MNNKKEKAVYALADILVREIVKEKQDELFNADSSHHSSNSSKTHVSHENLDHSEDKQK